MFLTQDHFLNQIHVPYSTPVEYSSLLDHHYSSSSFCIIIHHLLQNLSLFHTILLVPCETSMHHEVQPSLSGHLLEPRARSLGLICNHTVLYLDCISHES